MVGDQYADAPVLEMGDQFADIADGNRVDTGKRLIKQDEMRV